MKYLKMLNRKAAGASGFFMKLGKEDNFSYLIENTNYKKKTVCSNIFFQTSGKSKNCWDKKTQVCRMCHIGKKTSDVAYFACFILISLYPRNIPLKNTSCNLNTYVCCLTFIFNILAMFHIKKTNIGCCIIYVEYLFQIPSQLLMANILFSYIPVIPFYPLYIPPF